MRFLVFALLTASCAHSAPPPSCGWEVGQAVIEARMECLGQIARAELAERQHCLPVPPPTCSCPAIYTCTPAPSDGYDWRAIDQAMREAAEQTDAKLKGRFP